MGERNLEFPAAFPRGAVVGWCVAGWVPASGRREQLQGAWGELQVILLVVVAPTQIKLGERGGGPTPCLTYLPTYRLVGTADEAR